MLATIQTIFVILVSLICLYLAIEYIREYIKNKAEINNEKKIAKPPIIETIPEFIVFPIIILLVWLLFKYKVLFLQFFFAGFIAKILFWVVLLGLIGVFCIAGALYYRMYAEFWRNENMVGAQYIKNVVPRTIVVAWVVYIHFFSLAPNAQTNFILAAIAYHCISKFYHRILKERDFADETEDQQYRTRFNNRLIGFSIILCLIWFFVNKQVMYNITAIYLFTLVSYYNRALPAKEKYPVIKAPVGSPEWEEVYWDAFQAVNEVPIEFQIMGPVYDEEFRTNTTSMIMTEWGYRPDIFHDYFSLKYVMTCQHDKDTIYEEDFAYTAKTKLAELRNFHRYVEKKIYAVHEYYYWWLMKDVPFYFTIRAFFEMLWDISVILLNLYCAIFFGLFDPLFYNIFLLSVNIEMDITYNTTLDLTAIYSHWMLILLLYMGCYDKMRPYAWLIFYYRKQAYNLFDNIHPYAIYGPSIDGPRNWQYWFFIFFGYLPGRGLILIPELFAEELRMTEGALKLNLVEMDKLYDPEDITDKPTFWNPIAWYRFRNASEKEREVYRANIIKDLNKQLAEEYSQIYEVYSVIPEWWTHYSI